MWSSDCLPIVSLQPWIWNRHCWTAKLSYLYLATGARLGFLWLEILFPGFPSFVSPSTWRVSWFPRTSLHLSLSLSLLVSQPLWTASGVRLSRCLSSLKWLHLFPAMTGGLSILGGVVWLSECLSLRVFLHVSPILASGSAVRMSPLCFDLAAIIFPYHLSSDSSVSQLMCLHQSALQWWCLILSLFLTICFPLHLSPHSYVSPSGRCPVLISSRFHLWLTLIPVLFSHYVLLLSQLLHQHRPQIAIRWKNVSCDSCCSHLRWTKHCQHQELLKPQTCTQALQ